MNDRELKCDFCSAPGPTWAYPARDFVAYLALPLVGESVGAWAACEECHRLIEAGDHEGLAVRSLDELIFGCPEAAIAAPALKQELRQLHELFFANRLGLAMRTAPEPV
jgi:hypothetical protein